MEEEGCDEGCREEKEREAAAAEIEFRDKMFNAYKHEMEKYLSLFDEGGDTARKRSKAANKKTRSNNDKGNKPIIPTVGAMKSKFETLQDDADLPQVQKASTAVGKLDPAKMLAGRTTGEEKGQDKAGNKSFVAPVVIDKDAFDRTMKQFEHYR